MAPSVVNDWFFRFDCFLYLVSWKAAAGIVKKPGCKADRPWFMLYAYRLIYFEKMAAMRRVILALPACFVFSLSREFRVWIVFHLVFCVFHPHPTLFKCALLAPTALFLQKHAQYRHYMALYSSSGM
jgi:hypothetical protein